MFYRVEDPWLMPLDRFTPMVLRLFFYQGALQFRAQEESEEGSSTYTGGTRTPRYVESNGVDMRHNMAAAKSAARSVKGYKEGQDDEVKVVPAAQWMAMVPPGTVEHEVVAG